MRALFDAFASRDLAACQAAVHPDLELFAQPTAERTGREEPYHGRDGMREYLADVDAAWEWFRVEPSDFRTAGAGVICFGVATGRARGADEDVRVPVIWVYRVRDGLVAYCRVAQTAAEAAEMLTERPGEPA